jgi:diacylglycerol kinase (ATP)
MAISRKFLIVANPMARRDTDSIIEIIRVEAPSGAELDVECTAPVRFDAGYLRERAAGCEAVIAVGGDGTVAETTTALDGLDIPLGIIPAGSTNVIARNLKIPRNPRDAASLIFRRPATRRIDVGLCNGRRFLHMGGAGFDSRMFEATSLSLKKRLGWAAYLQGASKTIFAPPARFSIAVDGTTVECVSPLVLVANGASIVSPSFKLYRDIRYDDGCLDVIIFTAMHPSEIVKTIGRFATRSLEKSAYTVRLQGREIELRADPPIPLQLDGDIVGLTPARFSLLPLALEIIVPH